jgi:RNA polymerase sigma-70 factor, ECF subfamily
MEKLPSQKPSISLEQRNWLEEKITNNRGRLVRMLRGLLGTKFQEHTEDIFQIACQLAIENINTLENKEFFDKWFHKILINTAVNEVRKARRLKRGGNTPIVSLDGEKPIEVEDKTTTIEIDLRVKQLLQQLPSDQREIIEMKIFGKATFPDIVIALNIPLSTVKYKYTRGMETLKALLTN